MIVLSFALVLVALVFLLTGLLGASQALIWGSIIASAAAGLSLVMAVVQQRRRRLDEEHNPAALQIEDFQTDEPTTFITPVAGDPARERAEAGAPRSGSWDEHSLHGERRDPGAAEPRGARGARTPDGYDGGEDRRYVRSDPAGVDPERYDDPPDEPVEEHVSATDVIRTADLPYDVLVVDGRPRYHLVDCPHLRDRDVVSLPLADARESGFTPCSLCKPDSTLAARARERFGN